jgi:hypothetical protein
VTTSVELSVGLLRRFAEFTKKLSPEELEGIVAGTVKFGLLEPRSSRAGSSSKAARSVADKEQIIARLAELSSRSAATEYLDSLKLTVEGMKDLAQAVGAPLAGASRKNDIRDRIIEHTVGFRSNQETIRHGSW